MAVASDPIRRRCEWIHMKRRWDRKCLYMHTKDKNILRYVQKRLYDHCFPSGYERWANDKNWQQNIDQMWEDVEQAIENVEGETLDDFVSEMN
jgi:hypothetical protein